MKLQGQEEGHFIVFRLTSQLLTSLPTILAFSLCWCKECRNYTCSKHICGGIPSFEKSFMLEGIPVINWEQRRGGNAWQRLDNGPFLLLQYYSYLLMWDLVCL
ncbi:uncharacterized protein LOC107429770 isoform X9 [Ziziphus jujuba]|uniref:Uncharacterized protein LOC107429770 isoform X9 n=1 Tax=Ziziphus jujuba TaxID=326968 RepID=A0ABM3I368_ZIZJJ|nr:uncharacterized protein LOC107429770 isoform X9 [Ziziphus jujuba]